jgi:hypothetical protein
MVGGMKSRLNRNDPLRSKAAIIAVGVVVIALVLLTTGGLQGWIRILMAAAASHLSQLVLLNLFPDWFSPPKKFPELD